MALERMTYTPLSIPELKTIPDVARYRNHLAKMYRAARRQNRKLAILLRNRIKTAQQVTKDQIAERLFNYGFSA